ncbi:alpha/beta hydrolase [Christiangramia sp.]|uniref:alpha/beta fold hydrolase n=1 Tax=Christiangramia sp. TaxID=1931228 RepID=UPI00262412BA|nr:alpha/beta hydrolase [Christiangramia sp.]
MDTQGKIDMVVKKHEATGKYITVRGIKTFLLDSGSGEAIVCIHGVPTSSYLYRKMVPSIAAKGFRGIAIDLPGLGLSERPENFNYKFSNFGDFMAEALEELGIDKYHLVVHDIGGPVGFSLAAKNLEKILSLTLLNTMVDIKNFKKPLVMRAFEKKILGEAELKSITHATWPIMFSKMGVNHSSRVPDEEIKAYVDLLKREDNGKAFLKIMRNFEQTEEFQKLCATSFKNVDYPVQAIWGEDDPALNIDQYGEDVKKMTDAQQIIPLSSRHFLQEEVPEEIVEHIIEQAKSAY